MHRLPSSSWTLLVYAIANWDCNAAIDFLRGRGQKKWRSKLLGSAEEAASIVAGVRAAWAERSAAHGHDPTLWPDVSGKNYRVACRFVLEWKLYGWISVQNCIHGVAPSRSLLVEQVGVLSAGLSAIGCGLATTSARMQRKWLARFRRRWQARIGVLKVQEDVPLELRRSKAGR